MILFRLIIVSIFIYMGYKLYKGLRSTGSEKSTVQGKPKSDPLDLNNSDVEDAQFEEIDDNGS